MHLEFFLCKQFIDDMPKELFECAMLDNAGPFTIYRKIVLPESARRSEV